MRFQGKVALVTGGSAGIGKSIALGLAKGGASVAIAARRQNLLDETLAELERTGAKALAVQTDVTQEDQVVAMVERVVGAFGQIDLLVANAGMGGMKPVIEMSLADFMEPFRLNNAGTFLCCREVLRQSMLPRQSGAIVTFSSEGAKRPSATGGRLAASKAGIIGFTQALAWEVGRQGIRANCICPGAIMTDRLQAFFDQLVQSTGRSFEEVAKQYVDRTALGRLATSEEVANVTLFLCSDEASGMTGQAVNVGAGAVM